MASLNKCCFIGNLGSDPEVRYSKAGKAIANLRLACTHKFREEEHTEWVRVVMFDKLAEIAGEYLKKGQQVYVEGRMQTQKWQDKEGNDRYTTEILCRDLVMLGSKGPPKHEDRGAPEPAPFDEDIPF